MLDVREHLLGDGLDVAIVSVCHGARVLVVLVEGLAPQKMDTETEYNHLEGISLLSTGLNPDVEQPKP